MATFDRMQRAKAALLEAEADHPGSPALARLHGHGLHLVRHALEGGLISPTQADDLAAPQGGGTPKTPPPEE